MQICTAFRLLNFRETGNRISEFRYPPDSHVYKYLRYCRAKPRLTFCRRLTLELVRMNQNLSVSARRPAHNSTALYLFSTEFRVFTAFCFTAEQNCWKVIKILQQKLKTLENGGPTSPEPSLKPVEKQRLRISTKNQRRLFSCSNKQKAQKRKIECNN